MRARISGSALDSWLYADQIGPNRNADLYLILKVFLERVEPSSSEQNEAVDADGARVPIDPWGPLWEPWRQTFKRTAEAAWNERLWLVPSRYWGTRPPTLIPGVKCSLTIELANSASSAHLTARCVRPARGHFFRSFASRRGITIREQDTQPDRTTGQVVTAHEFGHWLGLDHVAGRGNEAARYGGTPHQWNDVMGGGARVEAWHAWPWRQRLPDHLDPMDRNVRWTATTTRPIPQTRNPTAPVNYHATDAGAGGGAARPGPLGGFRDGG